LRYKTVFRESDEDFASQLKLMEEQATVEGRKRTLAIREKRLKDSPETHMVKPGPNGVQIELDTHELRWEYYRGMVFSASYHAIPCSNSKYV
jgi:hypothetical protein